MPPPVDRLSKINDNRLQQKQQRQYVEALSAAAAAPAVASESHSFSNRESPISHDAYRSPSSSEEAPYVHEHVHMEHTKVSMLVHSRSNNSTTIIGSSRQAQQQYQPHAPAAAARQRGRPATSERASYRPFDDSVPWWLRVVREHTRHAHTQSKQNPQHSHTAEATTAQRLLAAEADRPNSNSTSTQQWRRRDSGRGQLRASEPPSSV